MTKSDPHFAGLQAAVKTEVLLAQERLARFEQLTQKIIAYQAGQGVAPTVEEFTVWCGDVKIAIAIRKLHEPDHCVNRPLAQRIEQSRPHGSVTSKKT